MPRTPLVSPQDASPEVGAIYADFASKMGFPGPPNFLQAQGISPTVVKGTWGLIENVLVNGLLPRSTKEMILVAISIQRNCGYCRAAHLACCRMLGVDEETINQLVENYQHLVSGRIRTILNFAVKCANDPQSLTDDDFASLKDEELSDAEILEVISMSAAAIYTNTLADALQVEKDALLQDI